MGVDRSVDGLTTCAVHMTTQSEGFLCMSASCVVIRTENSEHKHFATVRCLPMKKWTAPRCDHILPHNPDCIQQDRMEVRPANLISTENDITIYRNGAYIRNWYKIDSICIVNFDGCCCASFLFKISNIAIKSHVFIFALVHALKEWYSFRMNKKRARFCLECRVTITSFELVPQHVRFFGMNDSAGQLLGIRNKV